MQVILTHENADFDAIASLLAAKKLNPAATPVLPRKVNRNVRHFVTLYWDALPFTQPEDLPRRGHIDRVILVDTQGLTTLRGMCRNPQVQVIDHHHLADDTDPTWSVEGDPIGATTTLLAERFPEHGIRLTPIEATLLLLGIYEDTGSLTYGATTARDVRCAAWLLDQRADLGLMVRFLHHPLSAEQRALFLQLQDAAEIHQFDGQSVVVATVLAPDYVEEISTLAHKLRDLFEPEALFLLVQLDQHIQMVARSTTDTIDVGRVAAHFGGGGHDRAAAAIIRDKELSAARAELLETLPRFIRPSATVAQLMSHGVEMLPPDATINQAHERVLRLGYEGYPVVDGDRIIGLLTRRDIDHALQHKLGNALVERFMSPGDVSVGPDDSVPHLQSVMMEKGWGQIPVVSPQDGRVIGIVTRTDVISLWQPRPDLSERDQLLPVLERMLPRPILALVRRAGHLAQEMGLRIYFVGGPVRDLLLGNPNVDLDVVVEGDAIALSGELVRLFGGRVRTHTRFGTAKWLLDDRFWDQFGAGEEEECLTLPQSVDFVAARTEFYDRPTALPQVAKGSIKLDLHRRDFTINTLAIRLNPDRFGQLLDYYGGRRDLQAGVIRVLHSLSFIDDPTRILRAVRFEQRLSFRIEPRTEELLCHSVALLDRVTGERIRHELELLLREPKPELGFARLAELGVLAQIHPALSFDAWTENCFVRLRDLLGASDWGLCVDDYLIEFTHFGLLTFRMDLGEVEAVERRLRVRRPTSEHIRLLHALKEKLQLLSHPQAPSAVFQILEAYPKRVLLVAYVAGEDPLVRESIHRYVNQWAQTTTAMTGHDLRLLGLAPGPVYQELLNELLYARLDGRISTEEEERAYLDLLLSRRGHLRRANGNADQGAV
jgi:tRNA nucleotidyltransferase (CCA-adding enzyme)